MKQPYELPLFEYQGGLGQGGTARVALVRIKQTGRHAALKYPLPLSDACGIDFAALAGREHKLISSLKYPGLVRVLAISTDDPQYLLLELCTGPTLERIGPLPDLTANLNILSSIAINLEFIHARGIVHGDLKPDNIFLPSDWQQSILTPFFYTKLSDFSLGRFFDEPDSARAGLGTVGYMAPETVTDSRASRTSDMFSLGVVAYQLLTGRHPFGVEDHDPVKINSRVREDNPLPLTDVNAHLPKELNDLVLMLLAKREADRPDSGLEVCKVFRAAGATYLFERAIQPKHLIDWSSSPAVNIEKYLKTSQNDTRALVRISNGSTNSLRLLLSGNFASGNLVFSNGTFSPGKRLQIPLRLRQKALTQFAQMSLTDKKRLVKYAIRYADRASDDNAAALPQKSRHPWLEELLLQMLHQPFIRRRAAAMAAEADRNEQVLDAAHLYFRAGNLVDAERCAYQTAVTMRKESRHAEALSWLGRFIRYARMRKEEFLTRQLLMLQGDILKELGEAERAEEAYQRMIELYRGQPVDCLLAETYKDLGDLYKMKQKSREGIEALNRAIEIYEKLDDQLEISHTLNNLGNIYWVAGDPKSSVTHYLRALRIQRRLDAKEDLASTLTNLGSLSGMGGKFKRAVKLLLLSLEIKKELGNKGEIARSLNNLGFTYFMMGDNDGAVSALSESLETNRQIGSKKELLYNLENLTYVMIAAGRLGQSLKFLKEGMALATELNDKPHLTVFNLSMALVLRYLGRVRDADMHLSVARRELAHLEDAQLSNKLAIEEAQLLNLVGRSESALDLLRKSQEVNRQRADKPGELETLMGLVSIRVNQGDIDVGLQLAASLGLKREERILKFAHLDLLTSTGNFDDAGNLMRTLENPLRSMHDDIDLPRFLTTVGSYYEAVNDLSSAEACLVKAAMLAQSAGSLPQLTVIQTARSRIASSQGDLQKSYACLKNALAAAKAIAETIDSDADRKTYQSQQSIQYLVDEIKSIGLRLGQEKRAGVQPAPQ